MSQLTVEQIKTIRQLYPTVISTVGVQCFDADGSEVNIDMSVVDASLASTKYKTDRAAEYPAIGDQLDALFHAGVFPAEMAAQIQAIKDKYPKG
jgi:hypothetical protein